MNEKKKSPLHYLGNLDICIASALLVFLILLTFVGVLKRYIFKSPIVWMEEVQGLLFMWITFIGGGAAFRNGSHVSIEILVESLPHKVGKFIERFNVLIELVILGYLCSQEFAYYAQLTSTGKVTNLLRMPYSIAYLALPIGGILMIVSMLWAAYREHIKGKSLKGDDEE